MDHKAIRLTVAGGVLVAAAVALTLAVPRLPALATDAVRGGSTPGVSPTPVPSVAPSVGHAPAPVWLTFAGRSAVIVEADDCRPLSLPPFYHALCIDLAAPSWSSIPVSVTEIGPTPPMLARILRASVDNDLTFCADDTTLAYVRLGSQGRTTANDAVRACERTVADFRRAGTEIFDYTSADNTAPLKASLP